jgi:ATP-dependent helicase/nuclease subunit B
MTTKKSITAMRPRVFTIPPSVPFLPTLIKALMAGKLGFPGPKDPLALAAVTLYLPTRRACRLARDAFLDALEVDAAILPRIVPIGDIDEDELVFAEMAAGAIAPDALALPPALGGLERRLLLAQLVRTWARAPEVRGAHGMPLVAQTPAAATALADDLARLIDDMTMRGVSWDRLDGLVPEALDPFWQLTLKFLQLARQAWPQILQERGHIEPAARRDALIKAEAARLARKTDAPVIAAGSTGSIPATAELIATIARLPHGAVVLPGLDTDLDEASWRLIGGNARADILPAPGHAQYALQALLSRIGIGRDAVEPLAPARGRERLVSEVLRPAAATELWRQRASGESFEAHADAALSSVTMIEAANAEDEALAIAVALREAVEEGKTAALVTPDRALGARVKAALERWRIVAEDTGGVALSETPAGIFARLAAEVALDALAPVTLLGLLKHPLLRLGAHDNARAVAALERAALRGPRPRAGSAGLSDALDAFTIRLAKYRSKKEESDLHGSDPRTRLFDDDLAAAASLVRALAAALAPLESIGDAERPLGDLAARHRDVLAALSRDGAAEHAFLGPDGTKLADALDELAASEAAGGVAVAPSDYVELFSAVIADRVVRAPPLADARVRILGLLEARLTANDRVVLGGLVEGAWPPESRTDAWLSRPMRLELGLDLPERRIGLSAHDFAQMLGAPEVILTRAAKVGGAPTQASRFIQRLAAIAGETRWQAALDRGNVYLSWARSLDQPESVMPEPRPAPAPPRALRPKRLSVTEIEHWLRDPYTIYAKHVLKLSPVDEVDAPPGAAERGTAIHNVLREFSERYASELPADPAGVLIAMGKKHFAGLEEFPEARAFWWPRFMRIAQWLGGWEAGRRASHQLVAVEIRGAIEMPLSEGTFVLSGVADRIERDATGRYVILDYKTGSVRTEKQVRTGLAPQLTLEAAMLRQGGFKAGDTLIPAGGSVSELAYVALKGGARAGEFMPIDFKDGTPDAQADRALEKLAALVRRFDDDHEPYRSLVHPMWKARYGDYDHLARVKEWSSTGGPEDDIPGVS